MRKPQPARVVKGSEFQGVKELNKKMRDLRVGLDPAQQNRISMLVGAVLAEAAGVIRSNARQRASAQDVPYEVAGAIFAYSDPRETKRRRQYSALAGVSKRRTMTQWIAGKGWLVAQRETGLPIPYKPLKGVVRKVPTGGEVAMSKATMYEFGTTFMPARPFFRPAVEAAKPVIVSTIETGLKKILSDVAAGP